MKAFAKTNLILHLGPKNESGRYSTDFIMQEIDLADDISAVCGAGDDISIECDDAGVPTDSRNLCFTAAEILKAAGGSGGVKISIEKKIPSAGGLGGGSSDAAQVLKALNEIWELGITNDELIGLINNRLGTDASFFIKGGTASVRNNGLEVRKIETKLSIPYVFVLPDISVSESKTADVYKFFDPQKVTAEPDVRGMVSALAQGSLDGVAERLFNSFEYSLPPHYVAIPEIKKDLIREGCLNAVMCGAGPTVFGVCKDFSFAGGIAGRLEKKYPKAFAVCSRREKGGCL